MDARAIREAALKQVVVAACHLLNRFCKLEAFFGRQVDECSYMSLRDDDDFKRPDCPPGTDDEECVALPHNALLLFHLQLDVVGQEVAAVLGPVLGHLHELFSRLLGHGRRSPDLTVWVRV